MKIVVLDGYVLNPGDLSWDGLKNWVTAPFMIALIYKWEPAECCELNFIHFGMDCSFIGFCTYFSQGIFLKRLFLMKNESNIFAENRLNDKRRTD